MRGLNAAVRAAVRATLGMSFSRFRRKPGNRELRFSSPVADYLKRKRCWGRQLAPAGVDTTMNDSLHFFLASRHAEPTRTLRSGSGRIHRVDPPPQAPWSLDTPPCRKGWTLSRLSKLVCRTTSTPSRCRWEGVSTSSRASFLRLRRKRGVPATARNDLTGVKPVRKGRHTNG